MVGRLRLAVVLAALAVSGPAFAQTGTDVTGSGDASATAGDDSAAPVNTATTVPKAGLTNQGAAAPATAAATESESDVLETPGQTYYFLGAYYRGTIVPQFMVNLFVDEGATFYTNSVGLQLDIRKDHFSLMPKLNVTEYGFDPVLFLQKGKNASDAGNWSMVHSTLWGIYGGLDLLWSVPISKKGYVDFEYGLGVGIGFLFGNLYDTWVTTDSSHPGWYSKKSSSGTVYYQCETTGPAGCNASNHSGSKVGEEKIGTYPGHTEPNWFGGGSVPGMFIDFTLPVLGLRFKPIKALELRTNIGFSLTGFFWNLSGYFGFEPLLKKK